MFPIQLPEPVMTPGGNAQTKEEDVAGEVSKLESNQVDADGHNLPDTQRGAPTPSALRSHQP